MKDSECSPKVGVKAVLNLQRENLKLDAIIGSQCSLVCEPVGLLAAIWNIPLVASRCTSMSLSDKTMYPTFIRARGNSIYASRAIINVLRTFGWLRFSIISSDDAVFKLNAQYLSNFFGNHDMDVQLHIFSTASFDQNISLKKLDVFRSLIQMVKETSRVTLLLMQDIALRNFLILAKEQGFLSKDYVFIGLGPAYRGSILASGSIEPQITDSELYQGVIAVIEDDSPITEQWEKINNETFAYFSQQNLNKKEMEIAMVKHELFSGEEKDTLSS